VELLRNLDKDLMLENFPLCNLQLLIETRVSVTDSLSVAVWQTLNQLLYLRVRLGLASGYQGRLNSGEYRYDRIARQCQTHWLFSQSVQYIKKLDKINTIITTIKLGHQ
jgi:hypothetical protein